MSDDPFAEADRQALKEAAQNKGRQGTPMRTLRTARNAVTISVVRGRWHAVTGMLWLLAAAALWVAVTTSGSYAPQTVIPLWLLSFYSFGYLIALPFMLAIPGRIGMALSCLVYPTIFFAMLWLVASVKLYNDRGQHLLLEELLFRLTDAPSRTFILGLLLSWPALFFGLGFIAAVAALHWLHKPFKRKVSILTALMLVVVNQISGVIILGTDSIGNFNYFTLWQKPTCAPWCWVHRHIHRFDDGPPPKPAPDMAAAFRHDFSGPLWAPGPDPILSTLAGRYPGRNVVVILLESHRLAEVAPYGIGAWHHQSLSPRLSALCERGVFFSNYVQSGPGTFYARFSLATGLPCRGNFTVNGCPEGVPLMRNGPLAEFVDDHYRCEWLQSADPAFSGWDLYLASIGVAAWVEGKELAQALKNKDGWTCWGMPDGSLFDIAWNRYVSYADDPTPYLLTILSVSNHEPYSLPSSAGNLPQNHDGGMRYADACLGTFIDRLLTLPAAQRPVLLITGDHSHRDNLTGAIPIGAEGLEGIRIPGLLITPDGFAAGQVCTTPFVHDDALDLMHVMVGTVTPDVPHKFIDAHRLAVPTTNASGISILSEQGFYSAVVGACYQRRDSWNLMPAPPEIEQQLLQERTAINADMKKIWIH